MLHPPSLSLSLFLSLSLIVTSFCVDERFESVQFVEGTNHSDYGTCFTASIAWDATDLSPCLSSDSSMLFSLFLWISVIVDCVTRGKRRDVEALYG